MEILVVLLLLVVFGCIPMLGMLIFAGWIVSKKYPDFWTRVSLFLRFLLVPHLYLHQMYNYFAKVDQGYKTNVQYMVNGVPYEANGYNYYDAMWKATENPRKEQ